jgi:hypothetical protein
MNLFVRPHVNRQHHLHVIRQRTFVEKELPYRLIECVQAHLWRNQPGCGLLLMYCSAIKDAHTEIHKLCRQMPARPYRLSATTFLAVRYRVSRRLVGRGRRSDPVPPDRSGPMEIFSGSGRSEIKPPEAQNLVIVRGLDYDCVRSRVRA